MSTDPSGMVVTTRAREEVLYAALSGSFKLEQALGSFLEILDAIKEKRSTKVLIDGRRLSGEPLTIERFLYGEFVAEAAKRLGVENTPTFVYVLHEPVRDPMRFGEMVALNRGMDLTVFDDYDMATAWLGID